MANFKVKIPKRLELDGKWLVACVRFSYTNSLCTFNTPQAVYLFGSDGTLGATILIAPKRFKSVTHLCRVINESLTSEVVISENDRLPGLMIDKHGRVQKTPGAINGVKYNIVCSRSLDTILGTEREGFSYLNAFQTDLYLYLDCITTRVVGDVNVPLLTTIDIGNQQTPPGEQAICKIKTPEYANIAHSQIDEIEVQLLDDTGRPPLFEFGIVTITLHFKQRK